jgi:hypothetical protein
VSAIADTITSPTIALASSVALAATTILKVGAIGVVVPRGPSTSQITRSLGDPAEQFRDDGLLVLPVPSSTEDAGGGWSGCVAKPS